MTYEYTLAAIESEIWAITPYKLQAIIGVVRTHQRGDNPLAEQWQALAAARAERTTPNGQGVAILGLHGTIAPRVGLMTASGGTPLDQFMGAYTAAMNDPAVGAIVVDVDSSGGVVFGVPEAADRIRETRNEKPTYAVANHEAYSAAFWLGSAFGKFYVAPSGQVGSHGVVVAHRNQSEANKKDGVEYEFIQAGENKTLGNPHGPLTDPARADIQEKVDHYFGLFTKALALNRGVSQTHVLENFGQGKTFISSEAAKRGMVDGVATFDEVVNMAAQRIQGRAAYQRRKDQLQKLQQS